MTLSRAISINAHAALEVLAAPLLIVAPFALGFDYLAGAKERLHAKGLETAIELSLLLDALTEKSGTPVRISVGQPLRRRSREAATEAERPTAPRS